MRFGIGLCETSCKFASRCNRLDCQFVPKHYRARVFELLCRLLR